MNMGRHIQTNTQAPTTDKMTIEVTNKHQPRMERLQSRKKEKDSQIAGRTVTQVETDRQTDRQTDGKSKGKCP